MRHFIFAAVVFGSIVASVQFTHAQDNWQRGKIMGLNAGTCIREGPGLQYRAHTRVPENQWAVMVIDGPRTADGKVWWDTSRRAAGDPSGGTGWVAQDQSDQNCNKASLSAQSQEPFPQPSSSIVSASRSIGEGDPIGSLRYWWIGQSQVVKLVVAIAALLLAPSLWRLIGGPVIELISAVILSIAMYVMLDLSRGLWQGVWNSVSSVLFASNSPDLALLLAALPIASYSISLGARLLSRKRAA